MEDRPAQVPPTIAYVPLAVDPDATLPPGSAETSDRHPILPSAVPDGYEIEAELGAGGMGVVYRARHVSLRRTVAIKMLLSGSRANGGELVRFRGEAEAAAQLQHPNIVQVYEIGDHEGCCYIAFEFVDGGNLSQQLRGVPLAAERAARLVECLARAAHVAHQKGIVHRDLKPANILMTCEGVPKIADFGLAKRMVGGSGQTQSGVIVGTPSYMAPEQASGHGKSVGPAADVYALGAILYETITGRPPFVGETTFDTIVQVLEKVPVRPRVLNGEVPRDLETICLKALAKEPRARYPSALAFADDLARFADGCPIQARRGGRCARIWRWCRHNPALAGLSTLATVLFAAVVVLALMKGAVTPPPYDDSLARVLAAGKLRVATDPNYPPMEFWRNDELVGFDIDLARDLARRIGVEAEFIPIDWKWDRYVTGLRDGEFDIVISTANITDERKQDVDFLEYLQTPLVFLCRKNSTVLTVNDLAGKAIAVKADTTAQKLVEELQSSGIVLQRVVLGDGTADTLQALRDGRAEVVLVDEPVARYYARADPTLTVMGTINHPMDPDPVGIAFRKRDRELQAALANALAAMKHDGKHKKLLKEWLKP